jgi:hypothetical protein
MIPRRPRCLLRVRSGLIRSPLLTFSPARLAETLAA